MTSTTRFAGKVRKEGRSLVIALPSQLVGAAGLKEGDPVSLWVNEKRQIMVEKETPDHDDVTFG